MAGKCQYNRNQKQLYSLSMLDDEKNLITAAIKGEKEAFGRLYDHYQPKIYRFIYLKVSHREEAEDLTHQVFLSAWEKIDGFKIKTAASFSGWVYSIARNKVIDYYRTKKTAFDIEEIQLPDESPSNENKFDLASEIKKVRLALAELKPIEQDVVIMRFVEELSPKEAAVLLGKSEVFIRVIQHRALKNLRKILERNYKIQRNFEIKNVKNGRQSL